ncbi:MAG: GNAT family N-acetyltransferase [Candidatus Paceibacterota bacterium]|jgi:hypothetical protein
MMPKDSSDQKLKISRIDKIEEAKKVWQELSPNEIMYDLWDVRYCFYKYFQHPLFFYVGRIGQENIGLLPLQFNAEKGYLDFIGGGYMEDNRIFIKSGYEKYIPKFYEAIEQEAGLDDIIGEDDFTKKFDILEYKYVADLSGLKNTNDYLSREFSQKSCAKMKKLLRRIERLYQPKILENNFEDVDQLFELNIRSFGDDSVFSTPHRKEIFRDLLKLDLSFQVLTIIINGKKEAVSLALKYKDIYTYINSGANKKDFPSLGTYLTAKNFEKAISLGTKYLDAGVEDLGWKERWHLKKIPQRVFFKK